MRPFISARGTSFTRHFVEIGRFCVKKNRRSLRDYDDKRLYRCGRLTGRSLLPRALFVAISFQALFALVLVHLETALFLEVTHGDK
jgi:hypothetical protein